MTDVFLFDWGDTLMVDFPDQKGKMCDWARVEPVDCALDTLAILSRKHSLFVATNAADSTEDEIRQAMDKVGLARYISGYFCQSRLGVTKDSPLFYGKIVAMLGLSPHRITMVGDNLNKDIYPAIKAGINAVWLTNYSSTVSEYQPYRTIRSLLELCQP